MRSTIHPEVNNYFEKWSPPEKDLLLKIRTLIVSLVPEVSESFSYKMPAYKYRNKPLIYFAMYPNHLGVYATPSTNIELQIELSSYKQGKGSIQFPKDETFPFAILEKIILFKKNEIDQIKKSIK